MKNTQLDQQMNEQETVVRNHTLKEALEAKRLAAQQQEKQSEEQLRKPNKTEEVHKTGKKRTALWICVGTVAAVLVFLGTLWLLAPNKAYKLLGIDPLKSGSVVLTIDEYEISRDEYLSYVIPAKQLLEETYGAAALAQRDDLLTIVRQSAEESLFGRYTLLKWAAEFGITAESITEEELSTRREQTIATYGGKEAYVAALEASYTTQEIADLKLRQDLAIEKLTMELSTGENALFTVTDAQVEAYYAENNLYAVKHVLLLSDDYSAAVEKLESARKILTAAKEGQSIDELMKLYSEDSEKELYLDGYICQPGEQDPAFEKAALSVKPGELYMDVVSTGYGYHVIQRIQPEAQLLHAQLDTLIVDDRILQKRIELQSEMLVHYAPGYDNISFAGMDEALAG